MHTLGSEFIPPGFHAGGLRYHGMAPLVSHCKELGLIEARAYHQNPCFEAGVMFARSEGIVPAPESNHAVRAAIDEALKAREEGKSPTILFNLSGHGHFDMQAYTDYFAGKLAGSGLRSEGARNFARPSAESGGGVEALDALSPRLSAARPPARPRWSPHREVPQRAPYAALGRVLERRRIEIGEVPVEPSSSQRKPTSTSSGRNLTNCSTGPRSSSADDGLMRPVTPS